MRRKPLYLSEQRPKTQVQRPNLINKPLEPQLEHQERPQPVFMRAPPFDVFVDNAAQRLRLEQTTRECFVREQSLAQKRLHRAAEPVVYWDSESHLAALQVFFGHEFL